MDESLLLSFENLEERHWWFVVRRRIVLDEILKRVHDSAPAVLEVGCGSGGLLRALGGLLPHATALTGVEPNEAAAHQATSLGCDVTTGTFEHLPHDDDSVDLLIALDVLEHCEDDVAAAVEAVRVLAPGGVFVLTVPALMSLWGPHDELNAHHRRYTARSLREALTSAGLTVDRITYFNTVLLPIGYITRIIARITRSHAVAGVDVPPAALNAMLQGAFSLERPWLRRFGLPIGMSLLAVATVPRSKTG
ncbi:MAG: class I SAM-dependent methyltransferase [Coriobacteriia bacterium]